MRAFVTNEAEARKQFGPKIELAQGNFEDRKSLDAALRGIEKMYLLSPFTPDMRAWEASAIISAVLVLLMTWVVMPRVTRLFKGWLYPGY